MEGRGAARKFVSKNGEEEEIEKYKIITKKGGAAQSVSPGYGGRSSLPDASRKWRNLVSRRGGTLGELEKGVERRKGNTNSSARWRRDPSPSNRINLSL